ncbi:hypothetical protein ACG5V6_24700 [Streptomyces chitinivorans]|uniref:PH domain-containing protein n=1 Tax=Streptomyces chitinivorans TaxID=1257027 RepID=A0ABW7I0M7_9ACTN|nr:hypothetical protein [Streptomyces chitinivorans]MDH2409693.1 hypothetical protein [Streptomyces chitinivorans]
MFSTVAVLVPVRGAAGGPAEEFGAAAAMFGTVVFIRRIAESRIVLGRETLTMVEPLMTYEVHYAAVSRVGSDGGTLMVETTDGEVLHSMGFGGSLVDHFVGTTDKAVERIRLRLPGRPQGHRKTEAPPAPPVRRRVTRSWPTDIFLAATVICAACAGVVNLL